MSKFIFAQFDKNIDFAYTQNNIFLLEELKIVNSTGNDWNDIKITMSATPAFIKPQTWILERISSDSEKSLNDCIISTDTKFLQALTNDTEAEIKFTLETDFTVIDEYVINVKLPAYNAEKSGQTNSKALTRLDIWQKKLLNLSPSNPLLNCKINKTNIPVLCTNPGKLEDYIADGEKITLVSAEKVFDEKIPAELRSLKGCSKTIFDKAEKALLEKQMPVNVPEDKLKSQTTALYRKTKSILEEGGSNTLYLAIGFLNINPEKKTAKKYHAPLILCPVKLERITAQSGVKLSTHEDESRFNTTLLELLKQDFEINIPSLEGELPTDDSGLDVFEITNRVKNAIKDMPGFEVTDEVVLGHFSFNKYLMWKDLVDRSESMKEHPIVSAIINKDKKIEDDIPAIEPKNLDKSYKPDYFYAPLAADSSQLAILASADKGKSFVIEGPPGTGKSQTISNLIAHLLAKGKKVLFVAEKMAALDVVYKRLEKVGLGNYCLEIHSNKANKKDVLNKLGKSWANADSGFRDFRTRKAEEEADLLKEINKFASVLHTQLKNEITPYDAIENYIRNKKDAGEIILSWDNSNIHSVEDLNELKNYVHKIKVQAESSPEIFTSNIFGCITAKNWTPDWQNDVINSFEKVLNTAKECISAANEVLQDINLNIDVNDIRNLNLTERLIKILRNPLAPSLNYIFDPKAKNIEVKIEEGIKLLKAAEGEKFKIKFEYSPEIWKELDGKELLRKWENAKKSFFIKAYFNKKKIEKDMRAAGINGEISMPSDAIILKNLREISDKLNALNETLIIVPMWEGDTTDLEKLKNLEKMKVDLTELIEEFSKITNDKNGIQNLFKSILNPKSDILKKGGIFKEHMTNFRNCRKKHEEARSEFIKLCDPTNTGVDIFNPPEEAPENIETYRDYNNKLKSNPNLIKARCIWNKMKDKAEELNLTPITEAIEKNFIEFENIDNMFISAYYAWLSRASVSEKIVLRDFSSSQYEDMISSYKTCDNEVKNLSTRYIVAELSKGVPAKNSGDLTKEWKFLQREMQKQRQIKPVRQILDYAREAVQKLAPCFMMSPLSVAQYLPVSKDMFDVVIFDEASQITVWDAIGTLSRGKQIIVAGDPKQMPPSNFFGRTVEYNEEELGLEEDLESILDELTGSGIPTLRLNWHYRSKCESLISFSNKKYYDGTLVTFPSSNTSQKSVHFRQVEDGIYEKGARVNKKEAVMLVNECIERLTSPVPEIKEKSIGIVTFNSDQQKLIEDLLDKERELHPEIEFAFSPDNPEPLFVKNLETVQGDERDIILFSVTYGADKDGKLSLNFGPLNRLGGERRLNVAFTRAKYENIIFSSITPDQIDLNRTNSQGVADLKDYLTYAKNGNFMSEEEKIDNNENLFEKEICERLTEKGWKCKTKIGKSSLKVDIGIIDPENPNEFIAGIITDGDIYKYAATASDRVKTFPGALETLGWKLIKIHILDWWNDPDGTLAKLNNTLYKLYERSRAEHRIKK